MRIFVEPSALIAGELTVRGDEHHYLAYVRRVRAGDAVELFDGAGRRATATIVRIASDATTLSSGPPAQVVAAPPYIHALVPLIKGDRMDTCLEKLVEVGADAILVWPAARSVVQLDDRRRDARLAKYQALVKAAARQSGRAQVPEVATARDLAAAIAALPAGLHLMLDPTSDDPLAARISQPATPSEVAIISGPEGGLAPDERLQLDRAGFAPIGLGPRVLRAETAPMVAVALIRAITHT